MFSLAQAFRLAAPMPPTPIAARLSLLLGASWPPSTRLGTIAADSAAIAAVDVNCRRVTVGGESALIPESSVAPGTGSRPPACYPQEGQSGRPKLPPPAADAGRRHTLSARRTSGVRASRPPSWRPLPHDPHQTPPFPRTGCLRRRAVG